MALKFSFRHLFYGDKFNKQRFYETIKDIDTRLSKLESEYEDND